MSKCLQRRLWWELAYSRTPNKSETRVLSLAKRISAALLADFKPRYRVTTHSTLDQDGEYVFTQPFFGRKILVTLLTWKYCMIKAQQASRRMTLSYVKRNELRLTFLARAYVQSKEWDITEKVLHEILYDQNKRGGNI